MLHSDTHFNLTFRRTLLSAQNQVAPLAGLPTSPLPGRLGRPASVLIAGRAALRTLATNLEMNCLWRRLKANLIRSQASDLERTSGAQLATATPSGRNPTILPYQPLNTKLSPLTNKIHPSPPINPDQSGLLFFCKILFPNCIKMADYFGAGKEENIRPIRNGRRKPCLHKYN